MTTEATAAPAAKIKWALCVQAAAYQALIDSGELERDPMSVFRLPLTLADRAFCETDPSLRQLIPYIVARDHKTGNIYIYARGNGGAESRLFGNCSIGLGGHVDTEPVNQLFLVDHLVEEAMRELTEELGLRRTPEILGQIERKLVEGKYVAIALDYDVHQFHLCFGLVVDIDVEDVGQVQLSDEEKASIVDGGFKNIAEIRKDLLAGSYVLEAWSQITFEALENELEKAQAERV
jgi:predicted NUDIX family phosphoesterase